MLNQVIKALASHGDVVILGRGSFAVFAGYSDVLNVRVQAPFDVRVGRMMERRDTTDRAQAEAAVRELDKVRAAFVEFSYGTRWDLASAFDVVIDTGKVLPDLGATWLVEAARALKGRKTEGQPSASMLEADSTLAKAIADALQCQAVHS